VKGLIDRTGEEEMKEVEAGVGEPVEVRLDEWQEGGEHGRVFHDR
jgi:hypothetical protein